MSERVNSWKRRKEVNKMKFENKDLDIMSERDIIELQYEMEFEFFEHQSMPDECKLMTVWGRVGML